MSNVGWDLVCGLCSEFNITLNDEGCFLYGFMVQLVFTPISSMGVSVELTMNENGPVLKLETDDGEHWKVSRSWGSMSPFDEHTSWNVLIPSNKGDLQDELLSAYPTKNEFAVLKVSSIGGYDVDRGILLLRVWIEFFLADRDLHDDLKRDMRRGMLNLQDSEPESEPKPKSRRLLN